MTGRWLRALDRKGSCARGICIPIGTLGPLSSSIHCRRPVSPLLLGSSAEVESGDPAGDHFFLSRAGAVREGEAGTIDGSSAGAEAAMPPCISTMERATTQARRRRMLLPPLALALSFRLSRASGGGGGSNEKVRFQVIRKDPASRGTEESAAVLVAVQA